MIRLVVVEDDPQMLMTLSRLFASADGILLVGAYETAEKALTLTAWHEVVVLLTDPLTLQTIEELTHPDPRQQVGINLALRWGRTHKRTLTFV